MTCSHCTCLRMAVSHWRVRLSDLLCCRGDVLVELYDDGVRQFFITRRYLVTAPRYFDSFDIEFLRCGILDREAYTPLSI